MNSEVELRWEHRRRTKPEADQRHEYEPLQVRAVSTAVNKTGRGASKGPELIEPLADQPLQLIPA
jgi:hypothetical protein